MKQYIIDILHPFKAFERNYNKKLNDFLDKYKKEPEERTQEEKIVCEAYYYINFSGKNNMRYYGALETILVLNKYLDPSIKGYFEKEGGYNNAITKLTEQYLKDKNIL